MRAYKPGLEKNKKRKIKKRYNPKSNEVTNTLNYKNKHFIFRHIQQLSTCLLYTSPSPRDGLLSRMPSSA